MYWTTICENYLAVIFGQETPNQATDSVNDPVLSKALRTNKGIRRERRADGLRWNSDGLDWAGEMGTCLRILKTMILNEFLEMEVDLDPVSLGGTVSRSQRSAVGWWVRFWMVL